MNKRIYGVITLEVLLTVVGMAGAVMFYGMTYVQSTVAPVAAQAQQNTTDIASMQSTLKDTNTKVNALYNYFVTKGLTSDPVTTTSQQLFNK